MDWSEQDIRNAKNLLRAVNKATFNDMLGGEVLAFALCVKWLRDVIEVMENPPKKREIIEVMKNANKSNKQISKSKKKAR